MNDAQEADEARRHQEEDEALSHGPRIRRLKPPTDPDGPDTGVTESKGDHGAR